MVIPSHIMVKTEMTLPRWGLLVALLLLMTLLGARSLNADAIWLDEWWSIYHAGGAHYGPVSLAETWQRVANEDPWNAPGYYTILKGWGALVGWSAYAGRALSLLFGVLAAAMAYRMGREIGGTHLVGTASAITLGGSAFFIYYLHELRAYTLYAFWVTFTLWAYWRVVYRGGGRRAQAALLIGVAAMLYTHYFSALLATALGFYHLIFGIFRRGKSALRPYHWRPLLLLALGGGLFLPWLPVLIDGMSKSSNAAVRQEPISEALSLAWTLAYAFSSGFVPLLVVIVGAALVTLNSHFEPPRSRELREERITNNLQHTTSFAGFVALTVLLLALALNAYMSVNAHARHFMVLIPPLALLTGIGVQALARRRISPVVVLTLWLAAAGWGTFSDFNDVLFGEENQRYFRIHLPWHTMSNDLRNSVQEGDAIAFSVPENSQAVSGAFEYYMRPLNVPMAIMEWWTRDDTPVSEFEAVTASYTHDVMRLWLGQETDQPAGAWLTTFQQVIATSFVACGTSIELNGLRADLYARAVECCHPPTNPASSTLYSFGESLALTFAQPTISGDGLHVLMAWLGGNTLPPYQYSVALHITPAGENAAPLAQTDYGLPLDNFACRAADLSLADLPDGNYDLKVIVYDWNTGARLPTESGDSGVIETFTVGE